MAMTEIICNRSWIENVRFPTLSIVLDDYTASNLKQSLIGSNPMRANYNLRSTDTDIALPKPRREFLKKMF